MLLVLTAVGKWIKTGIALGVVAQGIGETETERGRNKVSLYAQIGGSLYIPENLIKKEEEEGAITIVGVEYTDWAGNVYQEGKKSPHSYSECTGKWKNVRYFWMWDKEIKKEG